MVIKEKLSGVGVKSSFSFIDNLASFCYEQISTVKCKPYDLHCQNKQTNPIQKDLKQQRRIKVANEQVFLFLSVIPSGD